MNETIGQLRMIAVATIAAILLAGRQPFNGGGLEHEGTDPVDDARNPSQREAAVEGALEILLLAEERVEGMSLGTGDDE